MYMLYTGYQCVMNFSVVILFSNYFYIYTYSLVLVWFGHV